jgi:hypothetical protein
MDRAGETPCSSTGKPKMSGYRRAVVALHEVCEQDRNWILALLPATERATLECYLDELKGLGFTSDAALSQPDSLDGSTSGGSPMQATPDDARLSAGRLRSASAHRIVVILSNEPPSLVAQIMAIEAWPWTDSVLRLFEPAFRARVNQARTDLTYIAPSRRRFVVQAVARRLDTLDAKSVVSRRPFARAAHSVAHTLHAAINRLGVAWGR